MANTTLQPLGEVLYMGLDVSARSGEIDFAKVRQSGRTAVYIRASVAQDYLDPKLDEYYIAARENDLLVGFFHVLTARDAAGAAAQAQFFLSAIEGKEMQLLPAMDFDWLAGLTCEGANQVALAFLDAVAASAGGAAIYTTARRAQGVWNQTLAQRYPLWIAECGAPSAGGNWEGWSGWQYAFGSAEGVTGKAGLDRFTGGMLLSGQDAPAAVPTLASASALASAAQTYTVQRGDTLSEIAARFGTTVSELVRLNNIADRDRIYVGQVLVLPGDGCVDTYVVQSGDTLSGIAARYGTTVARLAGINGIRNTDRIYVGQVLDLGLC